MSWNFSTLPTRLASIREMRSSNPEQSDVKDREAQIRTTNLACRALATASVEKEVSRVNAAAQPGQRHLQSTELTTRRLASFSRSDLSIMAETRLRSFDGREIWPPRSQLAAAMFAPAPHNPLYSADWAEARPIAAVGPSGTARRPLRYDDRSLTRRATLPGSRSSCCHILRTRQPQLSRCRLTVLSRSLLRSSLRA